MEIALCYLMHIVQGTTSMALVLTKVYYSKYFEILSLKSKKQNQVVCLCKMNSCTQTSPKIAQLHLFHASHLINAHSVGFVLQGPSRSQQQLNVKQYLLLLKNPLQVLR